jgi:hypothetical protein
MVDRVHGLWIAQGWVVHGGLATGTGWHARRSAACRRCRARGLTASWGKRRGAPGGAHRGLRWPDRRWGEDGGGEGWTAVMKLGVGRLGVRRVGNGGEEECGEEGRASPPFIRPEGGAGRPDGERDRPEVECAISGLHTFGFWEGKGGGKRGVKRGRVRRCFQERRGRRAVRAHAHGGAGGCAVGFSRRKKAGRGPPCSERRGWRRLWAGRRPRPGGKGGRWLGLGSGRRPKRGGGEWAGGWSHGPGGKRKGGRAETISRAEIQ